MNTRCLVPLPPRYGKCLLRRLSPFLAGTFSLWLVELYITQSLDPVVKVPPFWTSLGVFSFAPTTSVVLSLLVHLGVTLALSGLARHQVPATPDPQRCGLGELSPELCQTLPRWLSDSSGPGGLSPRWHQQKGTGWGAGVSPSWLTLGCIGVQVLWYLGHLVVPFAWFLVGATRITVIEGAYLVWLLAYFMTTNIEGPPGLRVQSKGSEDKENGGDQKHFIIRTYASLHISSMYALRCLHLPGVMALVSRHLHVRLLLPSWVGLSGPVSQVDILYLLAALLATTIQVSLGKWLHHYSEWIRDHERRGVPQGINEGGTNEGVIGELDIWEVGLQSSPRMSQPLVDGALGGDRVALGRPEDADSTAEVTLDIAASVSRVGSVNSTSASALLAEPPASTPFASATASYNRECSEGTSQRESPLSRKPSVLFIDGSASVSQPEETCMDFLGARPFPHSRRESWDSLAGYMDGLWSNGYAPLVNDGANSNQPRVYIRSPKGPQTTVVGYLSRLVGRVGVSSGVYLVLMLGYLLVVLDSRVGFWGLGYILLLLVLMGIPPTERQYMLVMRRLREVLATGQHYSLVRQLLRRTHVCLHSWQWWVPQLLALYCSCDLVLQYLLAFNEHGTKVLPEHIVNVVHEALGFEVGLGSGIRLLRLMRPISLLALLFVYRCVYALGMYERWKKRNDGVDEADPMTAAVQLLHHASTLGLFQRLLILLAHPVLVLVCFGAVVHHPSAVGLGLLVVGVVSCMLLGKGSREKRGCQRQAASLVVVVVQVVVAAWLVMMYAYQIAWLRHLFAPSDSSYLVQLLGWVGLRIIPPDHPSRLLRSINWKCVVLGAATLSHYATRWAQQLPREVVKAAKHGNPCPLFWPPFDSGQHGQRSWDQAGGITSLPLLVPITSAFQWLGRAVIQVADQLQAKAYWALTALDVPQEDLRGLIRAPGSSKIRALARRGPVHKALPHTRPLSHFGVLEPSPSTLRTLCLIGLATRGFVEGFFDNWGLEVCMLVLVTSAFLSCTVVSLLYLLIVFLGSTTKGSTRVFWWKGFAVPVLGVLLVFQYAVFLGKVPSRSVEQVTAGEFRNLLQLSAAAARLGQAYEIPVGQRFSARLELSGWFPRLPSGGGASPGCPDSAVDPFAVDHWLGLRDVSIKSLWLLFLSASLCVMQSHHDRYKQKVLASHPGQGGTGTSQDAHEEVNNTEVLDLLLDPGATQAQGSEGVVDGRGSGGSKRPDGREIPKAQNSRRQQCQGSPRSSDPGGAESRSARSADVEHEGGRRPSCSDTPLSSTSLFQPVLYPQQWRWSWLDWWRYQTVKYSLDLVLVSVVVLCSMQKDVVHAGYLAVALVFFRQRRVLQQPGYSLFLWLPVYNCIVIALTLAYQAPFQVVFGPQWSCTCQLGIQGDCSIPRLLGFCKILHWVPEGSGAPSLGLLAQEAPRCVAQSVFLQSGALADFLLWVLLRLQLRLMSSELYAQVMACVAEERTIVKLTLQKQQRTFYHEQADKALMASRLRAARWRRITQLKALLKDGPQAGTGPVPGTWQGGWTQTDRRMLISPFQGERRGITPGAGDSHPGQPERPPVNLGVRPGIGAEQGRPGIAAASEPIPIRRTRKAFGMESKLGEALSGDEEKSHGSLEEDQELAPEDNHDEAAAHSPRDPEISPCPSISDPPPLSQSFPSGGLMYKPSRLSGQGSRPPLGVPYHRRSRSVPTRPPPAESRGRTYSETRPHSAAGALSEQVPAMGLAPSPLPSRRSARLWQGLYSGFWLSAEEAFLCYGLYVISFVLDFSLITLVYPLSLFLYVLLVSHKAKKYWKVILVYTELVLIAQYTYQILARCLCTIQTPTGPNAAKNSDFPDPGQCLWLLGSEATKRHMDMLGLHTSAASCIPLFLIYLTTLMYNYILATSGELTTDNDASADNRLTIDTDTWFGRQRSSAFAGEDPLNSPWPAPLLFAYELAQSWGTVFMDHLIWTCFQLWQLMRSIASSHERPPHWVKVDILPSPIGMPGWQSPEGLTFLRETFQKILDQGIVQTDQFPERTPVGPGSLRLRLDRVVTEDGDPDNSLPPPAAQVPQDLNVTSSSHTPPSSSPLPLAHMMSAWDSPATRSQVDLTAMDQAIPSQAQTQPLPGVVSLLFEVVPEVPRMKDIPWNVLHWPQPSITPARDAAEIISFWRWRDKDLYDEDHHQELSRQHQVASEAAAYGADQMQPSMAASSSSGDPGATHEQRVGPRTQPHLSDNQDQQQYVAPHEPPSATPPLSIVSVEYHAREAQDCYTATAFLDFTAFVYVALFYQVTMSSTRTFVDLTEQRVLPLDYLGALLVVFLLAVMDRAFYALGTNLGKTLLFIFQLALFLPFCMRWYWLPSTSSTAHIHLAVFMLIKCTSLVLNALQLRSGYPPRASLEGQGRQNFFFFKKYDMVHLTGFYVFQAIPFLYELRALLDWTCTATTLSWYNWLKLEDVHASLYVEGMKVHWRSTRQLGDRVPRYLKFLQGTLVFFLLCLAIWLPLLLFSTGAPTYQVPQLVGVSMSANLSLTNSSGASSRVSTFPLFSGGMQYQLGPWMPDEAPLPWGLATYDRQQLRRVCMAQDSDHLWQLSPPVRQALVTALSNSLAARLLLTWSLMRSAPLASYRGGGPSCQAVVDVELSADTKTQLLQVLQGAQPSAPLMASVNSTLGPRRLYPHLWQLKGDQCVVTAQYSAGDTDSGGSSGGLDPWSDDGVGCDATLATEVSNHQSWWQLNCSSFNSKGARRQDPLVDTCPDDLQGPSIGVILERVQSGLLGATLSSIGITGLYFTFVYGIGRFLRLWVTNLRLKIPYEDLMSTSRLIHLVQDIYIARAEGELELEEELFYLLLKIYKNPVVLAELTQKQKKD